VEELTTRTLKMPGMTPARAYAALRAKTPGRTSYLLEAIAPDERGEQRSIIGFRAKQESAHPPSVDALGDLATSAEQLPAAPADPEAASACCDDVLMLLMIDVVLGSYGVPYRPEQSFVGREIRGPASVAFDHAAGTITIAATNVNVVERCARVLAEAPELPELAPAIGEGPEHMAEQPPDPDFLKQLTRAERRLSMGGVTSLLLARTFSAQTRGADLLDVYRSLPDAAPVRHRFMIDCAASPLFPAYGAVGAARAVVRLSAKTPREALLQEMRALFSIGAVCGSPAKDALAAWRDIASLPLGLKGGAVARARPGGAIEVMAAETFVTFEEDQFHTIGVADVVPGRGPGEHTKAAAAEAAPALAAIRRAHDSARLRAEAPQA
jgi:anthranilate synthase component 1